MTCNKEVGSNRAAVGSSRAEAAGSSKVVVGSRWGVVGSSSKVAAGKAVAGVLDGAASGMRGLAALLRISCRAGTPQGWMIRQLQPMLQKVRACSALSNKILIFGNWLSYRYIMFHLYVTVRE